MVDEAGYLTGDLASVAEKLGAPMAEVEAVLGIVQGFDPPGVCARNLTECLAIQLKERDRFDPAMQALVGRLDLLAKRDLPALRRICGVGDEDLIEMIAEIRRLNPKPGLAFGSTRCSRSCPTSMCGPGRRRLHRRAQFRHAAQGAGQPALSRRAQSHAAKDDSAKTYLAENLQSATWLIRALDQRAKTILKVATEIVNSRTHSSCTACSICVRSTGSAFERLQRRRPVAAALKRQGTHPDGVAVPG